MTIGKKEIKAKVSNLNQIIITQDH